MKISPKELELKTRLGPSKFSASGFMGKCSTPLEELIANDKKRINFLGISAENLAKELKLAYDKAQGASGAEIKIKVNFVAKFFESRGKIPSPFSGHGTFEKGETVLTNKKTKKHIIITKLGIDMIRLYSFFQGYGNRYRIDPAFVTEFISAKNL